MRYADYHEKKSRGTRDFPLEFYHIVKTHPRYVMSHHWHMEYEIIRILKGKLLITLDDEKFHAKPGDIIFIQSGVLHGGLPDNCTYECVVFDLVDLFRGTKVCHQQIQSIINEAILVQNYFSRTSHPKIHEIIWSLFDAVRMRASGYELTAFGHISRFLGYVLEHEYYVQASNLSKKNTKRILQLKKALELIETSYHTALTLDDLANAAQMNSKYFCKFFQEMTSRTPIEYLNYYRIETACFELITSEHSITDVGFNCGFNDLSYFIKTFKKYKGITPKKYLTNYIQ